MSVSRPVAVMLVVLVLLQSSAAVAVVGPSHQATSGVTYQTGTGLEVTLADDREVEAVPFDGDDTFASEGVEITAPGDAAATVTDATFDGGALQLTNIDATNSPIQVGADRLNSDVRIEGGTTGIIVNNITLDDDTVDLQVVAASQTTITVQNVPDLGGIQAVDSTGTPVAGETDTSDGTVTLDLEAGSYQLRLQNGPSELEVRDLVSKDLVRNSTDPITLEVEFFGDEGTVEQRTTTTGRIDMTGLPADERFSVSVDAGDKYVQRQVIIEDLLTYQTAYLLPQDASIDTVEPRFLLQDPSNQFDTEQSEIVLERPIDEGNGTRYVPVAGDRVGLNGFDTILERDQRYRVTVTDPDSGSQRQLGEFTPTQSEQVTLTVADVEFDSVSQTDGLEWGASYQTVEEGSDSVEFVFRDQFETQTIAYEIVERGNDSNVLATGTASGNVTVSEPVPAGETDTVWVVRFNATRGNGETLSASRQVSPGRLPGAPQLGERWQTAIAMISLFVVAGLFGAASPGVGGIAVASAGGVFFFIGWLPDDTGGLMVLLALFVAVLAFVTRKARGATA